jgi:hypothetical protein
MLVLEFQAKAPLVSCKRDQEPMRRKTFRLGCCAPSLGSRRHVPDVYHRRTHCARHRDAYITSEEMLARMKSHAGIRKLEKSEATVIARTIVDEAQPQGEIISILKRVARLSTDLIPAVHEAMLGQIFVSGSLPKAT